MTKIYENKDEFFHVVTNILHAKICEMGIEDDNDNLTSISFLEKPAERRYSYKGITLLKTGANENRYFILKP